MLCQVELATRRENSSDFQWLWLEMPKKDVNPCHRSKRQSLRRHTSSPNEFRLRMKVCAKPCDEEIEQSRVGIGQCKNPSHLHAFAPVEDCSCYPERVSDQPRYLCPVRRPRWRRSPAVSAIECPTGMPRRESDTRSLIALTCSPLSRISRHQFESVAFGTGITSRISP